MGTSKSREGEFRFKEFTVANRLSGMKVGTDGVLLGAWAALAERSSGGGMRALDVGSGSGLIGLMLAQRYAGAEIVGVEIDEAAVDEARGNVAGSPWGDRIAIVHSDFAAYAERAIAAGEAFDAVVSNPPYFTSELRAPDRARRLARHGAGLDYASIIRACAAGLLATGGALSVVSPADREADILLDMELNGLALARLTRVRTKAAGSSPSRLLWEMRRLSAPDCSPTPLIAELTIGSDDYRALTAPFYLR